MFRIDRSREKGRRNDSKARNSHEVKFQAENSGVTVQLQNARSRIVTRKNNKNASLESNFYLKAIGRPGGVGTNFSGNA